MAVSVRQTPERIRVERAAFRQVGQGQPPLWHDAGLGGDPIQPDGRWHRQGEGFVQYLAASAAGAWAELIRYLSLRTQESVVEQRRSLWQVHLSLNDVADLSTFDRWTDCGLDPQIAIADKHAECQDLAAWLIAEGYRGVVAPSAALPGSINISVFGGRYEHVALDDPSALPERDPDRWLRMALAAAGAHPPQDLVTRARYRGQPHGGYLDWKSDPT